MELAPVTLTHLRRADDLCARRLAWEHDGLTGQRSGRDRWRVGQLLEADARLAHAEASVATRADFRAPDDLEPEQRAVYDAAAGWYVALFAGQPARAVADDGGETAFPTLGIRLCGRVGLLVDDGTEALELRRLALERPEPPDDAERRFLALRLAAVAEDRPVRVVAVGLLDGARHEHVLDVAAARAESETWLAERVARIRARIEHPRPRRQIGCMWCPFLPQCPAHR